MNSGETNGQMWERMGIKLTESGQRARDKRKSKAKKDLPGELFAQCLKAGLPLPEREFRFHPERGWLLDLAWPTHRIAVECHGGVFSSGRHVRGKGFTEDRAKMNEAISLGWRVVEVTTEQIESGLALQWVRRTLQEN